DVAMLQEIFYHSDQRTTLRYIGINQDAMNNAMKKFKI
ncbi:site-specific integrase, partial [Bacillus subtilis]|nr:site-specific integrase [Bacillus subtilis]